MQQCRTQARAYRKRVFQQNTLYPADADTAEVLFANAEETGLIVEVGRWVLEQAVADVLNALGPSPSRVTGIDIEITESMVAQNTGSNVQKLQRLREAGLQIYVDDFGTGYSGCGEAHGYVFTRPMPAADITSLLPTLQ
jgi:EAL domain-containing protein (putative c-di-GMP-specific phosphodiesterase class I)